MYEQKIQFNYPICIYFDRSGITKFFGSRKEKDKTPPPTSPTPSSTGTATPTSTTAASPTHSNDNGDKIKENGSKEGGEEKGDGEFILIDLWFILLLLLF